jgi:hypothetical protein
MAMIEIDQWLHLSVLICRGCGAPTRERSADAGAMRCDKRCTGRVARRDDDIKTCSSYLCLGYERVENGLLSADNGAGLHYSCHTLYAVFLVGPRRTLLSG